MAPMQRGRLLRAMRCLLAERVAALSEAEIPVFSNAPVEIDAEALARGMSAVIVRRCRAGRV